MEENQPTGIGLSLPVLAAISFTDLALWSAYDLFKHMGDNGCDGGTCTVVLLFIPFIFGAYLLLLPAAFWLQRPRSMWGGIGAALTTLLGLAIATWLGEVYEQGSIGRVLLVCCWMTLAGVVVGFVVRASTNKP